MTKEMHVSFILDESGSMQSCKDATISGFNEYVQELQKDTETTYTMTFTKFNTTKVETVFSNKPLSEVPFLTQDTFIPDAMTPLYDAIGKVINEVDNTKENVLCVIVSDGQENSSREFTIDSAKSLITEKEKGSWKFMYLGANQDAWQVGHGIGTLSNANFDTSKMASNLRGAGMGTVAFAATNNMDTAMNARKEEYDKSND